MDNPADLAELGSWLSENNIDTTNWGHPGVKSIENLWLEIQRGETQLLENPPRRAISVAELWICRQGLLLVEVAQTFVDGSVRAINRPPSEKLLPQEDPCAAALRCLHEELAVAPGGVKIGHDRVVSWCKDAFSLSYPGLHSLYTFYRVPVMPPSLPDCAFMTAESVRNVGDPVQFHHWDWRPARLYASQ